MAVTASARAVPAPGGVAKAVPPRAPAALLQGLRAVGAALGRVHPIVWLYLAAVLLLYRKLLRHIGGIDPGPTRRKIVSQGGRRDVTLTHDEDKLRSAVVDPGTIADTLDSVGGLDSVKRVVEESIVLPLAKPHLFPPGSLRSPPKGVLLHGPPGTGKTLLARALAREAQAVFIEVRIDNLFSKWVGDSEKRIAAVFSLARKLAPSIVFVDEIDSLLGQRGGSCDTPTYTHAKTVFLTEWDGLRTDERAHRVIVVGATNRPGDVDDAVLRRMPVKLRVGAPNPQERAQILSIILRKDTSLCRKALSALPLKDIGTACDGYTGSDLRELCKEAAMVAVREQVAAERLSGSLDDGQVKSLVLRAAHFYQAMGVVGSNASFVRGQRMAAAGMPHFPLPSGLD